MSCHHLLYVIYILFDFACFKNKPCTSSFRFCFQHRFFLIEIVRNIPLAKYKDYFVWPLSFLSYYLLNSLKHYTVFVKIENIAKNR